MQLTRNGAMPPHGYRHWAELFRDALIEHGELTKHDVQALFPGTSEGQYNEFKYRLRHSDLCKELGFWYDHKNPELDGGVFVLLDTGEKTNMAIMRYLDEMAADMVGEKHTVVEGNPYGARAQFVLKEIERQFNGMVAMAKELLTLP